MITLNHGGEGCGITREVVDHEGHEHGRRVVVGDEDDHGST
jgi:hypothetical protein